MEFNNSQPIYQQIIDQYKKQLIRGELNRGDKILSQREYAERIRVNPNTVQRAYREMEMINMVETLRGKGTFIIISDEMLHHIKKEMANRVLDFFINEMNSLGYSNEETIQLIEDKQKQIKGETTSDRI